MISLQNSPAFSNHSICFPFLLSSGYAWLPLLIKDRINVSSSDHSLMVSVNLPDGYLSCKPLGFGKGLAGPDLKPVDNGKELFRLQLRMVSTVQSKDPFVHNFFVHCNKVLENRPPCMVDIVKVSYIHNISFASIYRFTLFLSFFLFRFIVIAAAIVVVVVLRVHAWCYLSTVLLVLVEGHSKFDFGSSKRCRSVMVIIIIDHD